MVLSIEGIPFFFASRWILEQGKSNQTETFRRKVLLLKGLLKVAQGRLRCIALAVVVQDAAIDTIV